MIREATTVTICAMMYDAIEELKHPGTMSKKDKRELIKVMESFLDASREVYQAIMDDELVADRREANA